jgi:hypothetical protein
MSAPTRSIKVPQSFQDSGTVLRVEGDRVVVQGAAAEFHCRRAVSCVVDPRPDDLVLFAGIASGERYVLAVLERTGDQAAVWSAPGSVTLATPDGQVTVAARDGVNVVTPSTVRVTTDAVSVTAREGELAVQALTYVGAAVVASLDDLKLTAQRIDTVAERLSQKLKRAYRTVSEIDQLRAEQGDWSFRKTLGLHAANVVATAKDLVKVDGDQIHLG